MTLPDKCPNCGSTEMRQAPHGGYAFFRYEPPKANLRKLGTGAKTHNENALARVQTSQRAPATEIVVCAKCGNLYAKEG